MNWKPIAELKITPEMENQRLLLYVEQVKLCARRVPEVVTADIIDGKFEICTEHRLEEKDWALSTVTHYMILEEPV